MNDIRPLLRILTVAVFSTAFLWRCANALAPTGGPRDTVPPVVVSADPLFNSTNFKGNTVFISFSEYVKLQNQQSEFFVSPPMRKRPTLTIKGRGIQVYFQDTLLPETTYALNFGRSVQDNNEGNPLGSFRYAFSTGESVDSMYLSAYVEDAQTGDTIPNPLLFLYRADRIADTIPDSTLLLLTPDVIARGETNGIVLAQNLKPVPYRVYAVYDKNTNFTYEPGTDKVGFLDTLLNPLELPEFRVWFDTTRNALLAQPQVLFKTFSDKTFIRQRLSEAKRESSRRITLQFSAPWPEILDFSIDGIPSDRLLKEYVTADRDTINCWLDMPGDTLPDTLKARLIYMRHDSLDVLRPDTSALSLAWRRTETDQERKDREAEEKKRAQAERNGEEYVAPVLPNPFSMTKPDGSVNPENGVSVSFAMPLSEMDTSKVMLRTAGGTDVPYTIERDTALLSRYVLSAGWTQDSTYRLTALAGAFTDVEGNRNDSLAYDLTVLNEQKYGTLTVRLIGGAGSSYVLYVTDERGNVLQSRSCMGGSTESFRYLNPGNVMLRVLEDRNSDGEWNSGDMIARTQPERQERYSSPTGESELAMKANWEVEVEVRLDEMFEPPTTASVRARIESAEQLRLRRRAEELERKRQQAEGQNGQQGQLPSGGFGSVGSIGSLGSGGGMGSFGF